MNRRASAGENSIARELALLWLLGACLRITILAVPPVIALIQADLKFSATEVGLLNSIPAAMFALAALPGALLVARFGLRRTLIIGLSLVAVGSACRGLGVGEVALFLATVVMGGGVALLQPVLPAAVRLWAPARIGLATAVYTNGLLVAEVIPVVLTLPLVLPLLHGWRADLVFWSIPVAMVTALVARRAPHDAVARPAVEVLWRPDWRNALIWRLALLFVGINSLYFGTNAFIPGVLIATGRGAYVALALTALNFAQIPASLLLLWLAQRLERRAWPYLLGGSASVVGVLAIIFGSGELAVLGAALIGCSAGGSLILALTLPALLAPPAEVARTSAAVFTVSYAGAVVIGVFCGLIWDLTGKPFAAFIPLALCGLLMVLSGIILMRRGALR